MVITLTVIFIAETHLPQGILKYLSVFGVIDGKLLGKQHYKLEYHWGTISVLSKFICTWIVFVNTLIQEY